MKKLAVSLSLLLFSILTTTTLAEEEAPAPGMQRSYLEFGDAIGTPAGNNVALGYWWGGKFPLVTQISGGCWGNLYGFQFTAGYPLEKRKEFKHFLGLVFSTSHFTSNATMSGIKVDFTGVGPYYGLNWNNFVFEVGIAFGKGTSNSIMPFLINSQFSNNSAVQLQAQIGYKILYDK